MLPGFATQAISAIEAKRIRRATIEQRNIEIAGKINNSDEQWLVWCGLNDEANELRKLVPDSVNVQGSDTPEEKAQRMLDFQDGKIRVLITKIKIAGMGMNLQNSHNMVFNGIDYSWEGYYQAIRRQWRHGQQSPVNVTVITTAHEKSIYQSVLAKEKEAVTMTEELIKATKRYTEAELRNLRSKSEYEETDASGNGWHLLMGDSAERMKELPDNSVDLSVYSPPFGIEIFVYSDSERDLSNSNGQGQFWEHYQYIIRENYRVQKPGTVCCVHLTDGRMLKGQHGYVGIKDFTGDCIEQYLKAGWEYSGRVTVWKNPQVQAIRLRMNTLQFTQMRKDSRKLRPGMPDYLLLFKKPGDHETPVTSYERGEIDEDKWIQWASPVWYDIKETNVLNAAVARVDDDEKHMCPLQLDFIERCIKLWSNPGETVFSPFAGIGSEGYEALRWNREFIGIELKPEYYDVACRNLKNAETLNSQTLFDWAAMQGEQS
jgi:DNA modification methylase